MNCQNVMVVLSDYLDGRLAPKMEGVVRLHLHSCASCQTEFESLNKAVQLIGRFEPHRLSPGFDARLFQRLEALQSKKDCPSTTVRWSRSSGRSGSMITFIHSRWRLTATAVALAAAGLASWQLHPGQVAPPAGAYISACMEAHTSFTPDKAAQHVGASTHVNASGADISPAQDINPDVDVAFETSE